MVRSESDLKQMTKAQLKQWLTKHDQRLPAIEKKKPYYLDRARKYFALLQQEKSGMSSTANPSRSKIKHKGQIVTNSRTKKKLSSSSQSQSQSKTPTSIRKKVSKTQRRHSSINQSPSASLSRSKRKVIKIKRKTPTKNSPSFSQTIRKKRERVRRATADHAQLRRYQEDDGEDDDDDDEETEDEDDVHIADITTTESENGGDSHNKYKQFNRSNARKKFVCNQDPERMTIAALQEWLDRNDIYFEVGQRKAFYVDLVSKHSEPLSKPIVDRTKFVSPVRNAPLPPNIRQSPLTPQDDEKMNASRSRIPERRQNNDSLLHTPALNKTGVSRIDTPSKVAMRDEIRTLLGLDDDDEPLLPKQDDDITPGGPSTYDATELNNVLSDLRKHCAPKPSPPKIKVFNAKKRSKPSHVDIERDLNSKAYKDSDIDSKDNTDIYSKSSPQQNSSSFINTFFNGISPHKPTSPSTMMHTINGVLSTGKKTVYKAHRTKPSPVSSPADSFNASPVAIANHVYNMDNKQEEEHPPAAYTDVLGHSHGVRHNNGNFRNDRLIPPTPMMDGYKGKGKGKGQRLEDDIPQTPAIPNNSVRHILQNNNQYQDPQQYLKNPRRSPRLEKKYKHKSPPKQKVKFNKKEKVNSPPMGNGRDGRNGFVMQQPMHSDVVRPSMLESKANDIPSNALNQLPFDSQRANESNGGKCRSLLKLLIPTVMIAGIAWAFTVFDGVSKMDMMFEQIFDFLNDLRTEQPTYFCDIGKTEIIGAQFEHGNYECIPCPKHASHCSNGRVFCKTNYIFQDNKCILDGITVKFAFQLKNQIVTILADKRGQYECGEIDVSEGFTMTEHELMSNVELIDATKIGEAFTYFKKNILPDTPLLSIDERGQYYSYKSNKSSVCRLEEWMWANTLFLAATFCIMMVFLMMYCQCKRKQNEQKQVEFIVAEIYRLLEEQATVSEHPHVPVGLLRQRLSPKSNQQWAQIEMIVQKDPSIIKSMRMCDGIQKKCWRLTSVPSVSGRIDAYNGRDRQYQHNGNNQQTWNFNTNSNRMQANNFDDEREEMTRFPTHSKRSMW